MKAVYEVKEMRINTLTCLVYGTGRLGKFLKILSSFTIKHIGVLKK